MCKPPAAGAAGGPLPPAGDPVAYRAIDRAAAQTAVVASRRAGRSLVSAAAAAGIHLATACRWQSADPASADALREAATAAGRERYAADEETASPRVPPGRVRVRPRVSGSLRTRSRGARNTPSVPWSHHAAGERGQGGCVLLAVAVEEAANLIGKKGVQRV